MKDIRPALRTFLLSSSVVRDKVGGFRIHHGRMPEGQLEPSVVFNRISETTDYTMDGDSGLSQVRMQIDAWATTSDEANSLAGAVYDRLTGQRGEWQGNSETVEVNGVFVVNSREEYDATMRMFRMGRDYLIWYRSLDS